MAVHTQRAMCLTDRTTTIQNHAPSIGGLYENSDIAKNYMSNWEYLLAIETNKR